MDQKRLDYEIELMGILQFNIKNKTCNIWRLTIWKARDRAGKLSFSINLKQHHFTREPFQSNQEGFQLF